jgi:endonuclease/exonuclease/phosphatase family metal-dependent hydrolase
VLLHEVGRGRLTSGTSDTAGWLARRLSMHLIWGPAADNQSGNAVLSRLPIRSSGYGRLPRAGDAPVPGYVWARVETGGGRTVDVWSTRLTDVAGQDRARELQAARLLAVWGGGPRTIIAVSMNERVAGATLDQLSDGTGLRHALNSAGPAGDWLVGTDDVFLTETNTGLPGAPGRPPVAATVRVGS